MSRKIERIDWLILVRLFGSREGERLEVGHRLGKIQKLGQLPYVGEVDTRKRNGPLDVGQEKVEPFTLSFQPVQVEMDGQGGTLQT